MGIEGGDIESSRVEQTETRKSHTGSTSTRQSCCRRVFAGALAFAMPPV